MFFFYLPMPPCLTPTSHPSCLQMSFPFRQCLNVWVLFSLAWCSVLLDGERWFRRCVVTRTYPNCLPPFICESLLMPTDNLNTQQACHTRRQVDISSRLFVFADYLHIELSVLACCRNTCDLQQISHLRSNLNLLHLNPSGSRALWPWLYVSPEAPFQSNYCWLAVHLICWWRSSGMWMWTPTLPLFCFSRLPPAS